MGLNTRNHRQVITVWPTTPDENGGFIFDAPSKCKGRWEDTQKAFITPQGTQEVSRAVVYLEIDARIDDYVYLGDAISTADPTGLAGALPIRQFLRTPSLRTLQMERKAIL